MKKNIVIYIVIAAFSIFMVYFAYITYQYYRILHSDDPIDPYLSVSLGQATIVRGDDLAIDMGSGEVYDLQVGDTIITRTESLAILHWPDHSETRLGAETRLAIKRMEVADDYSSIEIDFAIEEGKIWTNVVRTIYPGSYFRARLPEGGIIAGVRGTTFDINLDLSYIRSIDHSISLTDSFGHIVSLLPGEAVSSRDILKKIGANIRDAIWENINTLKDTSAELARTARIDQGLQYIQDGSTHFVQKIVRYILSFFGAFDGIEILEQLDSGSLDRLKGIPEQKLLEWYQKFQDKKYIEEREFVRQGLIKVLEQSKDPKNYLDSLARGALWDSMFYSGMTIDSATMLIDKYSEGLDSRIKNVLNVIPVKDLEKKSKETLRSLMQ